MHYEKTRKQIQQEKNDIQFTSNIELQIFHLSCKLSTKHRISKCSYTLGSVKYLPNICAMFM